MITVTETLRRLRCAETFAEQCAKKCGCLFAAQALIAAAGHDNPLGKVYPIFVHMANRSVEALRFLLETPFRQMFSSLLSYISQRHRAAADIGIQNFIDDDDFQWTVELDH
uniref:Rab-GAP TBC domain-containing protein n=1 Tax=Ascaris lumbricoides TaxID=6252 RepID=A0A0M3HWW6_ASCLU